MNIHIVFLLIGIWASPPAVAEIIKSGCISKNAPKNFENLEIIISAEIRKKELGAGMSIQQKVHIPWLVFNKKSKVEISLKPRKKNYLLTSKSFSKKKMYFGVVGQKNSDEVKVSLVKEENGEVVKSWDYSCESLSNSKKSEIFKERFPSRTSIIAESSFLGKSITDVAQVVGNMNDNNSGGACKMDEYLKKYKAKKCNCYYRKENLYGHKAQKAYFVHECDGKVISYSERYGVYDNVNESLFIPRFSVLVPSLDIDKPDVLRNVTENGDTKDFYVLAWISQHSKLVRVYLRCDRIYMGGKVVSATSPNNCLMSDYFAFQINPEENVSKYFKEDYLRSYDYFGKK